MKTNSHKIALVTGGNSGIGYATAKYLLERGYQVYICGRDSVRVNQAADSLQATALIADLANMDDTSQLAEPFVESGLDLLVNNAAIASFAPLEHITQSGFMEFVYTNLGSPLFLIQALLPALEKKQGSISFISSAVTRNGLPNASLYAATKGGIDAITRSLAIELAPRNIRVNAVSPGAIDTPIINKLGLSEEVIGQVKAQMEATIPMHRYGRPEEVAQVIVAQAEASYVTGSIWSVDGGIDAM